MVEKGSAFVKEKDYPSEIHKRLYTHSDLSSPPSKEAAPQHHLLRINCLRIRKQIEPAGDKNKVELWR